MILAKLKTLYEKDSVRPGSSEVKMAEMCEVKIKF